MLPLIRCPVPWFRPGALLLVPALILSFALPASGAEPPAPVPASLRNPGFEEGTAGGFPPGWGGSRLTSGGGYAIQTVEEQPARGNRCVQMALVGDRPPDQRFGNLLQSIDAVPFRGKRVRFRAAVRAQVEEGQGQAQLWMRVDRASSLPGFFDNMDDRPITSPRWGWYEIVGDVAADAEKIYVGMILSGGGKAWLDSASFEVLSDAGFGNEPPRPLAESATENLVAFTRLLAYLRFFHPSDQAAKARWQDWALAGIPLAEGAETPQELAATLERFFHPIAPTVQIFPTDSASTDSSGGVRPPPVRPPRPPGPSPRIVAWRHYGVEIFKSERPYQSRRIDNRPAAPAAPGYSVLRQSLDARPYRGKKIRFRAALRVEPGDGGRAQLWLRVDRPKGKFGFFDNMQDRPVTSDRWQIYEINGEVAEDAETLVLGLLFYPGGKVWIDEASLEEAGGPEGANLLQNPGFEEALAGDDIPSWSFDDVFRRQGYQASLDTADPYAGRQSVCLSFHEPQEPPLPRPEAPFTADLEGGISVRIPLALYADAKGTLPPSPGGFQPPPSGKPQGFSPSGNDRTTRLAAVALSWGVLQHFYPNFDVAGIDWKAPLRPALQAAATDENEAAFLRTLQRLVAVLRDGQASASQVNLPSSYRLPLAWDWIEDRLVLTGVDPQQAPGLVPGDVVLKIGDRPAREALAAEESLTSAANPGRLRYLALTSLAQGAPGEKVQIEVQRRESGAGGTGSPGTAEPLALTLQRSVPLRGAAPSEEPRPEKIAEIRPGIFYIDLTRVGDTDFAGALDRLAQAKGIVFDSRGYPVLSIEFLRHFLDRTVVSPRWQIPIVRRPDREDLEYETSSWSLSPLKPRLPAKIAFLADARTGGGNETCLTIVEHSRLGDIVGSPSAGVISDFNAIPLPGGYFIFWTAVRALRQDGAVFDGSGIQPTVPVSRTIAGVAQGRDEILEKALEIVSRAAASSQ
jgi:C-terminal processing protease CtpA/Prc